MIVLGSHHWSQGFVHLGPAYKTFGSGRLQGPFDCCYQQEAAGGAYSR